MKKISLLLLVLTCLVQGVMSQTATGVITQVPCNNDGIYTVSTTGLSLPITYTYYVNGASIVHANVNSTSDQLTNIPLSVYNFWSCNVSSGGSSAWTSTSYTAPFSFQISSTSPVCPATIGTVTATRTGGTTGPFLITWTNKQTLNTYSGSPANVPVGDYSVEITDQTTGCVLEIVDSAAYVTQLTNVTGIVSSTVASCTNGTATATGTGGTSPYTYLWSTGATSTTITGLSRGHYTVEITDALGCKSNTGVSVQQNPNIIVNTTVTNATCLQSDGSAIAFGSGGVNPYTYSWSNGQTGNTATGLTGSNSYIVIATDANGCTGQKGFYISSTTPISTTYTSTPSSCTAPTGSATLSITGGTTPYSVMWNTHPASTGITLSNVSPGTYGFKVTDAVGCVRSGSVVISPNSTINANLIAQNAVCPNMNGKVTASVTGSNPPFTYSWSNSATTSQITGLSAGYYSCIITDAVNCTVTKSAQVKNSSPVFVSVSTIPASCKFNKDGAATATVYGGVPPYTYSYSSGANTASASGLGVGNYWLTVTDNNGCSSSRNFWIHDAKTTNSCYCTISGHVYFDANANCTKDGGENGIDNIMIHCSGNGYTFTNANGYYSFQVPTGSYTITEQINAYYPLSSCQSNNIPVTVVAAANCITTVDIANDMAVINDLKITTVNSNLPPIPGHVYQQKIIVKNWGTVTESGIQMGYAHDGQLPFVSSTLSSFVSSGAPNAYQVTSGFPTLAPNAYNVMLLNYNTPTNIPISTAIDFYDTVAHTAPMATNWLLDYTPWNNVNSYQTAVIGSFDPNYKEVYPKGEGDEGLISNQVKELNYTIHFQNEGTYFANNVVVTDQLDEDLDWTTFVPGYSDHDYFVTISETGLATFTFPNIHLPWKSNYGDALSSGMVNYSIRRKPTNLPGTEFTNYADIFFDYNEPITTNTTLNTLDDDVSVVEIEDGNGMTDGITLEIFPNPAKEEFTLRLNHVVKNEAATLRIVDVMGKTVVSERLTLQEGTTVINQDVSKLASGSYITIVLFGNGQLVSKKLFVQ